MIRFVLELPAALVALMVKVVVENTTDGVPEMIPVVGSNDKPVGSEPPEVMAHVDAPPPVLLGVAGVIVLPTE